MNSTIWKVWVPESVACHLLHCRFTTLIWIMVKDWLGLPSFNLVEWVAFHYVEAWWFHMVHDHPVGEKGCPPLLF
jgi:hypothetical protein